MRLRAATTKTRPALWVELHPVLADALEATLGPREDRDPEARLFAESAYSHVLVDEAEVEYAALP